MAVDRELRRLLQYTRLPVNTSDRDKDGTNSQEPTGNQNDQMSPVARVPVKMIYERLRCMCRQHVLPSTSMKAQMNLPELLVLIAEAAVYQNDMEVADACVTWFLSECRLKNQFYYRIQLVRAQCASMDAVKETGAVKLRKVLNAIHFVMLVLPVATDPKQRLHYDFLVYNASVTYWRIARQLMKKATFQYLLPSLNAIIDALKAVGEKDIPWVLRLQIAMVHAQIDAKQLASAAKLVCDIVDVQFPPLLNDATRANNDTIVKALYEEALRLQVHAGSFKDPECQKILANVKKMGGSKRTSLITKLQALKSGAFAGTLDAALTELFQETTGMMTYAVLTTTDEEIVAHLRMQDPTISQNLDSEILVEVGIVAAFRQEYRHAACCDVVLQAKGKSVEPKSRVLHQVLKAILTALVPPPTSANFKLLRHQRAALVVARRLEGVKAIERALFACKRQQDPTLLENVCLYGWNLSLPLLQPQSREQLLRLYSLASSSLEELQSLQLNLRVRLMLELAKLEVSADFISKAQENVNKALGLDYGTITATATTSPSQDDLFTAESMWMRRPLDVHLLPLRKRLNTKLAVEDPATMDEELSAAVEQLREANNFEQRQRQLDRVLVTVDTIIKKQENGDHPIASLPVDLLLHLNTTSAFAWHEMRDVAVATKLTREALRLFFSDGSSEQTVPSVGGDTDNVLKDKSVMLLEVDLRLRLVELIGHDIKTRAQRFQTAMTEYEAIQSGKKKFRGSMVASRRQQRPIQDDQAMDDAAIVLLSKESYALGIATISTTVREDNDQVILDRRAAMEAELLSLKTELIHELTAALRVSTRIGWGFVIENTAVYLWNYHFHVFRSLFQVGATVALPSILPDCIAAFEAALAALEVLPPPLNLDLLMSIALGLALIQKKSGKLDKAVMIADSILKRHRASATMLSTPQAPLPSMSLTLLKRFGELKVRIQIQQNAKEVVPVDITPQVKVASFLEGMEVMFHQHSTNTTLPPAQLAQTLEKALGYFQKAMTTWQPIATESLERMKNESLTLEEQQQHLEMYCEIWVRLGCGAFRMRNVKQAIDCGEQALLSITQVLSESEQRVWVTEATWRWLAIAEMVCGRSILALLSGETAAWTLIEATLSRLVRASQLATRAGAVSIVRKATEVAWNAVLTAMSAVDAERAVGELNEDGLEAQWWSRLLPKLLEILKTLGKGKYGRLFGDFGLLVLDVCEKAADWKTATGVSDSLLHSSWTELAPDQVKDITTVQAIAVASLGEGSSTSSTSTSSGKGKDHDPLVQVRILQKIAFSSWRNPPAQLKALTTAHKELDGNSEEQALLLMEMAEWFFTHQFPSQEVHTHLDTAMNILVRGQHNAQSVGSKANDTVHSTSAKDTQVYAPLWYADQLIRLFTTKAVCATSMDQRWEAVRQAVHHVYMAWQCIIDHANDADLREKFALETPSDPPMEFEEWKVGKPTKFDTHSPRASSEWFTFYQQYATSLSNRFYIPWLAGLNQISSSASISNPNLTGSTLERLLGLLASFGAEELSLPVVCFYQVVYFAISPQKCKTIEIWLELMMYDVLEKFNVPVFSVPLQSALELLQTSGDAILRELQQQKDETDINAGTSARHRFLLQRATVNVSEKVVQTVELLVRFGYIRQAKVLLTMLHNIVHRTSTDSEVKMQSESLMIQVRVVEGDQHGAIESIQQLLHLPTTHLDFDTFIRFAVVMSEHMSDNHKAMEALLECEELAADTILSTAKCAQLCQPMHTQAVVKYLTSLVTTTTKPIKTQATVHNLDIDAICGLARLKLRQSILLLKSDAKVLAIEHAQRIFQESIDLLVCIDATKQLAEFKMAFAEQLVAYADEYAHVQNARQHERWLLDARGLMREALVLLEGQRNRAYQPTGSHMLIVAPLDIEISKLKLQLAMVEMNLEESCAIVTDMQMTWYAYEKETRHNIVEKWLDQTAAHIPIERPGSISRAYALASAVSTTLANCPDLLESRGLATVCRLRCERLVLYHDPNKQAREAVHRFVWTRFTCPQTPHATWICAVSNSTNVRTSDDGGRSTPGLPVTEHSTVIPTDSDLVVQQQLATLTAELEIEMKSAIEKRHVRALGLGAFELVQMYGCNQPLACAKAMLHYQSTVVRERHMKPLIDQTLASTNTTRLHMNRCNQLIHRHTNPFQNSLPFQLSQQFLEQQSDIYKRMNVCIPMDTIIQILPPTTRILSLQFSPDHCFLYAAMVSSSDKCVAVARMECTTTNLEQLGTLRDRIQAWRARLTTVLVEDSSNHGSQQDTHEFVVASEDPIPNGRIDALESEFETIIEAMDEFFHRLFAHSALVTVLENELPGNSLVIIADRELELLPFEALPALEKADAISREFSIHMLYHRLTAHKVHPFHKDDIRTIVDPRNEDTGLHDQTLASVFHQFTKKPGAVFASWKDAVDHGFVPTMTDWQEAMLLRKCGGLVYVGPNRAIGSSISLSTLAGMNLGNTCYALVLLDRAENQSSARRLSKIDSEKTRWERELEDDPYACALLCSLCGINVVVLNQWTTTFHANRRLAGALLGGLAKGQTLSRAVRKYPEIVAPVEIPSAANSPKRKTSSPASSPPLKYRLKQRIRFNTVVFGLGHLSFKGNE